MKKSYKITTYQPHAAGFAVLLDGKGARTPGLKPLVLPVKSLAERIVQEWRAQGDVIRRESMPLTQIAVIAIDLVAEHRPEVTADVLAYADTDLICYRAGGNQGFLRSQAELLDPLMAWAEERFDVGFMITDGVMPVKQPAGNHAKLASSLEAYDDWKLAALAAAIKPLSSLVIALALIEGRIDAGEAFHLSHLEESFETEGWGKDEEKEKRLSVLKAETAAAEEFLALLNVK